MACESILEQPPETVIAFQKSPGDRRLPRGNCVIGLLLARLVTLSAGGSRVERRELRGEQTLDSQLSTLPAPARTNSRCRTSLSHAAEGKP